MYVLKIEFDELKIQSNLRLDNKLSRIINTVKSQFVFIYFIIDIGVKLNIFFHIFYD